MKKVFQSYGEAGEAFSLEEELLSKKSSIRRIRSHKASESDDDFGVLARVSSIKTAKQVSRQESMGGAGGGAEDENLRKKRIEKLVRRDSQNERGLQLDPPPIRI